MAKKTIPISIIKNNIYPCWHRVSLFFPEHKTGEQVSVPLSDSELCLRCKGGRRLCGKDRCPFLDRVNTFAKPVSIDSDSFWGSSPPSVFVGRYGYPKVKAGPLLPPMKVFHSERLEDTSFWLDKSIEEIIALRTSMYRTGQELPVKNSYEPSSPLLSATQELALSAKSVDTEVLLTKVPKMRSITSFDSRTAPMGPSVEAKKVTLADNPKVPKKVDYLTSDIHARAVQAMEELYMAGIPVNHIMRVLSSGLLGRARDRRLVPTRWSITAVDDIIGKSLAAKVRYHQQLNENEYFHYEHFGNHFYVMLIPGPYSFEMLETWLKGAFWTRDTVLLSDHEGYGGRSDYADRITGAYYAARLEILAHLHRIRRQATMLIFREITDKYWAPLGVWVIRDGVREAMTTRPRAFPGTDEMVSAVTKEVIVKNWARQSYLLRELRIQKRIDDYVNLP